MVSTYTTNKRLEKPGNGDYVDTWNVPVNADLDVVDQAFGGTTALNATGGSATLTFTQYRSLIISVTGAISASVTYTIPSGVGGQWIVYNSTTDATGGPWTVTIASGGGGSSVTIPRSTSTLIYSNGTSILLVSGSNSSNQQVIYNSSNILVGSSNLTFTGTQLNTPTLAVTGNMTASGSITATGNVTAYSDERLKKDIETIEGALDMVKSMRGVKYTSINTDLASVGVIAQEMAEVCPQVVQDNGGMMSVAYGNLVGVLIEAIKELSEKVAVLENK
jgi:hypothetical protein